MNKHCALAVFLLLVQVAAGCDSNDAGRDPLEDAVRDASAKLKDAADAAGKAVSEATKRVLREFNLTLPELEKELKEKGRIVREKVAELGAEAAEVVADATLTAKVKAKLLSDPEIPAMVIDVDTRDRNVTLRGRVASVQQVQAALSATLQVSGVRKVTSELEVKADDGTTATKSGAPK